MVTPFFLGSGPYENIATPIIVYVTQQKKKKKHQNDEDDGAKESDQKWTGFVLVKVLGISEFLRSQPIVTSWLLLLQQKQKYWIHSRICFSCVSLY